MNINASPHMNHGHMNTNNGMMDMFRSQLMTMTMFSTINGNNMNGNTKNSDTKHNDTYKQTGGNNSVMSDSLYGMLYIFLITQFVDFVCKNMPVLIAYLAKYYRDKINNSKFINSVTVNINNKIQTKSSSIIVKLNIADTENTMGQALMDYITNNNNTKHVSFNKLNFILHS
jgi:hypothetical protein